MISQFENKIMTDLVEETSLPNCSKYNENQKANHRKGLIIISEPSADAKQQSEEESSKKGKEKKAGRNQPRKRRKGFFKYIINKLECKLVSAKYAHSSKVESNSENSGFVDLKSILDKIFVDENGTAEKEKSPQQQVQEILNCKGFFPLLRESELIELDSESVLRIRVKPSYSAQNSILYVDNLPGFADDQWLRSVFSSNQKTSDKGRLIDAWVIKPKNKAAVEAARRKNNDHHHRKNKGFGFVQFDREETAKKVMENFRHRHHQVELSAEKISPTKAHHQQHSSSSSTISPPNAAAASGSSTAKRRKRLLSSSSSTNSPSKKQRVVVQEQQSDAIPDFGGDNSSSKISSSPPNSPSKRKRRISSSAASTSATTSSPPKKQYRIATSSTDQQKHYHQREVPSSKSSYHQNTIVSKTKEETEEDMEHNRNGLSPEAESAAASPETKKKRKSRTYRSNRRHRGHQEITTTTTDNKTAVISGDHLLRKWTSWLNVYPWSEWDRLKKAYLSRQRDNFAKAKAELKMAKKKTTKVVEQKEDGGGEKEEASTRAPAPILLSSKDRYRSGDGKEIRGKDKLVLKLESMQRIVHQQQQEQQERKN